LDERKYLHTQIRPFPRKHSVILALWDVHLCLARNYDYVDNTRSLSWAISFVEVNCAADRQLPVRWLSASPITRIGLALPVNIFLWQKFFLQLSNTCNELRIKVLFVSN
jgi:hypothetical protein